MQQFGNTSRLIFGCVMAKVDTNESQTSEHSSPGNVDLRFCRTSDNDSKDLTVTSEMRELTSKGYFLAAVAKLDVDDLNKFTVWMSRRTSELVGPAFVTTVRDLVDRALVDLVANQSGGAGRMC